MDDTDAEFVIAGLPDSGKPGQGSLVAYLGPGQTYGPYSEAIRLSWDEARELANSESERIQSDQVLIVPILFGLPDLNSALSPDRAPGA